MEEKKYKTSKRIKMKREFVLVVVCFAILTKQICDKSVYSTQFQNLRDTLSVTHKSGGAAAGLYSSFLIQDYIMLIPCTFHIQNY